MEHLFTKYRNLNLDYKKYPLSPSFSKDLNDYLHYELDTMLEQMCILFLFLHTGPLIITIIMLSLVERHYITLPIVP